MAMNMKLEIGYFRYVHCRLCGYPAGVKWTKTNRLMIRCVVCNSLLFANGNDSQELVQNLPEFEIRNRDTNRGY